MRSPSTRGQSDDVEEDILNFRSELLKRDPRDISRRFLTFGSCKRLDDEKYHNLKDKIAQNFGVHPNEVIVVGSAKLGFSIAPQKIYQPFGETSDIDATIVSPYLFDIIWMEVLRYISSAAAWDTQKEFNKYFIRGWIRPDKLPSSPSFKFTAEWFKFFQHITNSRAYSNYKISCGLYRDWLFLEEYQKGCITKCRQMEAIRA